MNEIELKKRKKKYFRECFINVQFLVFVIMTVVGLLAIYVFNNKENLFFHLTFFGSFFIFLSIIGYISGLRMLKKEFTVKNGEKTFQWEPYKMPIEDFFKECETGFLYSYVEINGNIHVIEAQLNRKCTEVETCYIDDVELKGLDEFYDYKIDGNLSLKDLDYIIILDTIGKDPKKVFVDKII